MKKNYRVVRNESDPVIPPRPDFAGLLEKVQADGQKTWWKKPQYYISGGLALVAALVLLLWVVNKHSIRDPEKISDELSMISPPVKDWDLKSDTFKVDLTKETILEYHESRIIIPANSIEDENGKPVSHSLLIYREIDDQAELMASGVSLASRDDSGSFQMETAGVIEIRSGIPGHRLAASGIRIEKSILWSGEEFNWYVMNSNVLKWDRLEAVNCPPAFDCIGEFKPTIDTQIIIQPPPISPPQMRTAGSNTFKVIEPDVPELAIYKDFVFEVLPGQNYVESEIPDNWDGIRITKSKTPGVYNLELSNAHQRLSFRSIPVFEDPKAYDLAVAEYKKRLKNIDMNKHRIIKFTIRNDASGMFDNELGDGSYNKVKLGEFNIRKFGVYAIAKKMLGVKNTHQFKYRLLSEEPTSNKVLYHFVLTRNGVSKLIPNNGEYTVNYSREFDNMLVSVDVKNKKISVLDPQDFREQVIALKRKMLVFRYNEQTFNRAADIQEYINNRFMVPRPPTYK